MGQSFTTEDLELFGYQGSEESKIRIRNIQLCICGFMIGTVTVGAVIMLL